MDAEVAGAEDAVEAEAFAALNVKAVTSLAGLFQHVPQGKQLDNPGDAIVILGDMTSTAIETKDGNDEQGEIVVVSMVVAEERKALRRIQKAIKGILHNHRGLRGEWQVQFMFKDEDGFLDPESGEVYLGNSRFTWFALAAS